MLIVRSDDEYQRRLDRVLAELETDKRPEIQKCVGQQILLERTKASRTASRSEQLESVEDMK